MPHIIVRIQVFDQVFKIPGSRFCLFKPAASTKLKISPLGCFNLCQ